MSNNHRHIDQTLNHLFRQESGKMVAVLTKIFGTENLQLAEDVVQEALISALETWKFNGIPDNPSGWLYRCAKNKAIDVIRKNKHANVFDFSGPEHQLLQSEYTLSLTMDDFWDDRYIKDDFLAMMFACCLPQIATENQITFMLKNLCGFSTKEVANALLSTEETITKRIYRTKKFFREAKMKPEIPTEQELGTRLNAVLSTIYLLFNEAYLATNNTELIRNEFMAQAISLCQCLVDHEKTRRPQVYALMALICFHSARNTSRINEAGELIMLNKQDRALWDKDLIKQGNEFMNKAAYGESLTNYHIEAAISYEHCMALSYEKTDWPRIHQYYNLLWQLQKDPITWLNRCLVVMETEGPAQALEAIKYLDDNKAIQSYSLYYAVYAEIFSRLGMHDQAAAKLQLSIENAKSDWERSFYQKKAQQLNI